MTEPVFAMTMDTSFNPSDIETWKAKIAKAEDDIVKNERAQEQNLVDQEAQRRTIEEVRQRLNNVENERN